MCVSEVLARCACLYAAMRTVSVRALSKAT